MVVLLLMKVRIVSSLSSALNFVGPPLIIMSRLIFKGKKKSCLKKNSASANSIVKLFNKIGGHPL